MSYEPIRQAVRAHPLPAWFDEAKLGIFIHWNLSVIPAWAPPTGEFARLIARKGIGYFMTNNPYADWYLNSIRIPGSPAQLHHERTYGAAYPYDRFAPQFNQAIATWDPGSWADLFQQVGARYIVLTTKHHDGFLLWPSAQPNPYRAGYHAGRDIVGELSSAVRARGLRMGLYYSGGLDWTFNPTVIRGALSLLEAIPQTPEYTRYADGHWRELIDRYAPAVLWNDIGYPAAADLDGLFAYYYDRVPDGVVNDRFSQSKGGLPTRPLARRLTSWALDTGAQLALRLAPGGSLPTSAHYDFRTTEYASYPTARPFKWEATRGIGYTFGYNQEETAAHMVSVPALVRSFVDIVSKNGNLLLNVGPMADGTIPPLQRERLLGLGQWLAVNGEAIFGTRPWRSAGGRTAEGVEVRFTQKGDAVYAILLGTPAGRTITLRGVQAAPGLTVQLLGGTAKLAWQQRGKDLAVTLPEAMPDSPAHALRLAPAVCPQS